MKLYFNFFVLNCLYIFGVADNLILKPDLKTSPNLPTLLIIQ